jgi:hypothetical protein
MNSVMIGTAELSGMRNWKATILGASFLYSEKAAYNDRMPRGSLY